jgi:hypothetical protein
MTSQRRRRRKKAEKAHRVVARPGAPHEALPPAVGRPQDEQLIAELDAAIERHLDLSGVELERLPASESIAFGRKGAPIVYVFADKAVLLHGARPIPGDFRAVGEHWAELRSLLLEVQGVPSPLTSTTNFERSLLSLPPSLSSELASAALEASARIRADLRVFPCLVVLDSATYEVRFEPIRRYPRLLVPFSVRRAGEGEIEAALDLTSTADLIAVAFEEAADEARVAAAWPVALLAFADLIGTHTSVGNEGARAPAQQRRRRPAVPRQEEMRRRLPPRTDRGSRPPSALKPLGETAKRQGSFVIGHRRRLPPGRTCRDDARAAARAYGIELDYGWTWVQPHERGIPAGFVLRYAWRVPPQLAGLRGSAENGATLRVATSRDDWDLGSARSARLQLACSSDDRGSTVC